jgi:hypothetical protein
MGALGCYPAIAAFLGCQGASHYCNIARVDYGGTASYLRGSMLLQLYTIVLGPCLRPPRPHQMASARCSCSMKLGLYVPRSILGQGM